MSTLSSSAFPHNIFMSYTSLTLDATDRDFASVYDSQENDIPQDGTSSFLKSNEEASTLRVQNEQNEDPLLPFYAKAREEAETAVCLN